MGRRLISTDNLNRNSKIREYRPEGLSKTLQVCYSKLIRALSDSPLVNKVVFVENNIYHLDQKKEKII